MDSGRGIDARAPERRRAPADTGPAAGGTVVRRTIRPRRIHVSASTLCTLHCPACPNPHGEIAQSVGVGHLRAADLLSLLDLNPWVHEVEVSGLGEPFLNPEMPAIVAEARSRGVALTADNGTTLNAASEELLGALVEHHFRRITCSIDGATQGSYSAYRVGGDLPTVLGNIRRLNELKTQAGSRYPRLTWQFVVFAHNEREIPLARRMAAELGMDFRLKESWAPELSPARGRGRSGRRRAGEADDAARDGGDPDRAGRVFCHQLWEEPQVNWDGRVLGCCCNYRGDFGGNAFFDGLLDVLNSASLMYARAMLLGRVPPRARIPCTTCDVFRSMARDGHYLRRGAVRVGSRAARFAYHELGVRRARAWVSSLGGQ